MDMQKIPVPHKLCDVVRPLIQTWRLRRSIQQSLAWHHVNRDAADAQESAPPQDERLELPCVWVTEAYTPSNVHGLVTALQKLGWDKPTHAFRDTGLIDQIQQPRSVSNYLSWANGGVILAPGDTRFIASERRYGRLPRGVDYCALDLRGVASSLTLLTIQFVLTEDYAECLNAPLTASYRTSVTYHPSAWRATSATYNGVTEQKAAAVKQRRDDLHDELCNWLRRNLPGYFASQRGRSYPIIDLLTSRTYNHADEDRWRRWDDYLAIVFGSASQPWRCTSNEQLELQLPGGDLNQVTATLFGNLQALVDGGGPHEAKGRSGLPIRLQRPVGGMASAWSIHHLLLSYEHGLAAVRDRAASSTLNVRRALKDIAYIHQQYLAISRDVQAVAADVATLTSSERRWQLAFQALDFAPPHRGKHIPDFIETLRLEADVRAKQLDALEARVSKAVFASGDLATAAANLRIQRYVFWLTIVTAALAAVSVVATLDPLLKPYIHW